MKLISFIIFSLTLISCASSKTDISHQEMGTLWIQSSAEAKALIYQSYNLARLRLDMELKNKTKKKRAIVVDADETIVDNSPYQGKNIKEGRVYNRKNWEEWIDMASAKALPGSVEFLNYAQSKGVDVYFITNRKHRGYEATLKNLKELGFPVVRKRLMLKTRESSSKKIRRDHVAKTHNIIMLMGDSLGDFADIFEYRSFKDRSKLVDQYRKEFGKKFIVLPNPMYGEWIQSLYEYDYNLSEKDKKAKRIQSLKAY